MSRLRQERYISLNVSDECNAVGTNDQTQASRKKELHIEVVTLHE